MATRDEPEVSQEEAQKLLVQLLKSSGAEIDPERAAAEAAEAEASAKSDRVDARPDAKPLLGTAATKAAAPMPSVGRGPRKKP